MGNYYDYRSAYFNDPMYSNADVNAKKEGIIIIIIFIIITIITTTTTTIIIIIKVLSYLKTRLELSR